MIHRFAPLVLVCLSSAVSAQATFTAVPDNSPLASCRDVTPDGSVVVGSGFFGGWYWRWKEDPMPVSIGGQEAVAVSDDGTVIAGNIIDPLLGGTTAGIWTEATGWVSLGALPGAPSGCGGLSSAYDISGDGSTVVGLSWANGACLGRAFRWTAATDMEQLEVLGNDRNRASVISSDGSLIGGFAQGNFNRTPAVWYPDKTGDIWDIDSVGEVNAVDDFGSLVGGSYDGSAFYATDVSNVFTLDEGSHGSLGNVYDIAENARMIGFSSSSIPAYFWSPGDDVQTLNNLFVSFGVPTGPSSLSVVTKCSADGTVIVGHTFFEGAWILEIPGESSIAGYGCGVNPAGSLTVVSGAPDIGKTVVLGVDNPAGTQGAGSLPIVLFATDPAPGFPCGIQIPGLGMSALGASGELLLSLLPPNPIGPILSGPAWTGPGTPAEVSIPVPNQVSLLGFSVFAQGFLYDPLSTFGITAAAADAVELVIGI